MTRSMCIPVCSRINKFAQLLIFVALACQTEVVKAQAPFVIEGPSDSGSSVEGTFRVTLNHSLSQGDLDCFFDSAAISIPIAGEGFVVSNVQSPDRDSTDLTQEPNAPLMLHWGRSFVDELGMPINEAEINGQILTFDVYFEDGITDGSYTIGQETPSGGFHFTCYDGGVPILAGQGQYFDNFRGRTFLISEPDGCAGAVWCCVLFVLRPFRRPPRRAGRTVLFG